MCNREIKYRYPFLLIFILSKFNIFLAAPLILKNQRFLLNLHAIVNKMKKNFLRKNMALVLIMVTLSQSFPTLFFDFDSISTVNLVMDLELENDTENESEKEKEIDEEKNKVYPSSFAMKFNTLRSKKRMIGILFDFNSHSQDIFLPPPELKQNA